MDKYDCPVCGFMNFKPKKPGEEKSPVPTPNPEFRPRHTYPPKPSAMVAGGIGSYMLAISSILLGILPLLNWVDEGNPLSFSSYWMFLLFVIAAIMFVISCSILLAGFYGFFKYYKSSLALATIVFIILGATMMLLFTILSLNIETSSSYRYSYTYYEMSMTIWGGHIFAGIMAIFMGVSFLIIGKRIGFRGASYAAGTIFIVAGCMLIGLLGFIGVAWFMLAAAGFIAGTLFLIAKPMDPEILTQPKAIYY